MAELIALRGVVWPSRGGVATFFDGRLAGHASVMQGKGSRRSICTLRASYKASHAIGKENQAEYYHIFDIEFDYYGKLYTQRNQVSF
jgi:hypothetical protein